MGDKSPKQKNKQGAQKKSEKDAKAAKGKARAAAQGTPAAGKSAKK